MAQQAHHPRLTSFDPLLANPFFALLVGGVKGFGGVSSALRTPLMKRSSAPGSSSTFTFWSFAMSYKSPFDLPDEHMRLVGIIACHWECLDLTIQRTIAEVMQHKFERVALLTENLSFNSKMDLLTGYVRMLKPLAPTFWDEYTSIQRSVIEAYGTRNSYVHARWKQCTPPETPTRVVVRIKGGKLRIEEVAAPQENLEKAAQSIWDVGQTFTTFFTKFGLLQALPSKLA